ncbi:methyltransferase domain-containing protein [Streptomyces sp. NPDC051133]|uniref:methyltransferase domain-containing protein n=1 Tax=Streptomyces sp. NPDC051133 TaxID=3155521 RepID=UPI003416162A
MTMFRKKVYGARFYTGQQDGSARSAGRVLPLVFDLVRPRSVIDLGCGTASWLAVARSLGAETIVGVDGGWVAEKALRIPPDCFLKHDLAHSLDLNGRRFDLAMSLEAAEHLDAFRADSFVADLCALADVVLFSAAIPGQTGTNHRNEQWATYWRDRFQHLGYQLIDCLRSRLWDDPEVEPWYAQNAYLYVSSDRLATDERLRTAAAESGCMPLDVVHPGTLACFSKPYAPKFPVPREQRPAPMQFTARNR